MKALRVPPELYQGHRIAAAPGTHEAVVSCIVSRLPPSAAVLDLGAYTGALIRRLRDAGFPNVAGADLADHLTEPGVPFVQCDFNAAFADAFDGQLFDCISVCEVIEHLDDPRRFLAECRKLLNDGGLVVISTPNIAFFEGRIKFLLTGELWGFGGGNYRVQRHITPISREQFPLLLEECGFDHLDFHTAGSFATTTRKLLTAPIWAAMRLTMGRHVVGETAICVGRKSDRQAAHLSSEALWGVAA